MQIPYEDLKRVNAPYLKALTDAAQETIENGWYILGQSVKRFEKEFSAVHDNGHCIGVASGLDAMILGLAVFGFRKNAKVLVPSNTYIATILAIIRADLQPVLVEPDPYTYNITAEGLEKSYDKDCVAILPVHLYGRICPMEEIMVFAQSKNLKVIEDCAQSHFAEIKGKKAGTFGDIGAFSFYPTKNLGAIGDAGAIVSKDQDVHNRLLALRNYGSYTKYFNEFIGWNSRLDEIQAAFLSKKLKDKSSVLARKRRLASVYMEGLANVDKVQLPRPEESGHVWHIFNILVENRDLVRTELLRNNVGSEIHYPIPPHHQVAYRKYFENQSFPISERIHAKTLSLPISTFHTDEDIECVIVTLKEIINKF